MILHQKQIFPLQFKNLIQYILACIFSYFYFITICGRSKFWTQNLTILTDFIHKLVITPTVFKLLLLNAIQTILTSLFRLVIVENCENNADLVAYYLGPELSDLAISR